VRQAIRRQVAKPYLNDSGDLAGYFLDPALEHEIESAAEHAETASHLNLSPQRVRFILDRLSKCGQDSGAVVLTSSASRFFLRQIAETALPNLTVLSHVEIPAGVRVLSLGILN
jgi:flagellar biosynthesis component FlhA